MAPSQTEASAATFFSEEEKEEDCVVENMHPLCAVGERLGESSNGGVGVGNNQYDQLRVGGALLLLLRGPPRGRSVEENEEEATGGRFSLSLKPGHARPLSNASRVNLGDRMDVSLYKERRRRRKERRRKVRCERNGRATV